MFLITSYCSFTKWFCSIPESRSVYGCPRSQKLSLGVLHIQQINWALVDIWRPQSLSWAGVSPWWKELALPLWMHRGEFKPNHDSLNNMSLENSCPSKISSATPTQNWAWNSDLESNTYLGWLCRSWCFTGTSFFLDLLQSKQTVGIVHDVCQNAARLDWICCWNIPNVNMNGSSGLCIAHPPQFHHQM